MSTHAIIQARMGSTRFPAKIRRPIAGMLMMDHVLQRARLAGVDHVTIAMPGDHKRFRTPYNPVFCWGGEDDVLGRIVAAHEASIGPFDSGAPNADDIIVRLTADTPFVPVSGIVAVIRAVELGADYAKTRSDPSTRPNGIDVQAFRAYDLIHASLNTTDAAEREHVTPAIERAAVDLVIIDELEGIVLDDLPSWRLTVDTPDDWRSLGVLADHIPCHPPEPTLRQLVDLFDKHPELARYEE
jgi:spore coat polysaccharide biosynthesis protein SpsF (cytidylyltransferase family)